MSQAPSTWIRLKAGTRTIRVLFPGLVLCLTVAAAARFLSDHYGAPQMLFALLLGMAFHFLVEEPSCAPGIEISSRMVLRIGVALLGLRITVDEVMAPGRLFGHLDRCRRDPDHPGGRRGSADARQPFSISVC